eukprot:5189064-Pyramimonas_sp.AAC.1
MATIRPMLPEHDHDQYTSASNVRGIRHDVRVLYIYINTLHEIFGMRFQAPWDARITKKTAIIAQASRSQASISRAS